jgi:hypothetical protein
MNSYKSISVRNSVTAAVFALMFSASCFFTVVAPAYAAQPATSPAPIVLPLA